MKIIFCSDIHENKDHLHSILSVARHKKVDCIIIGGDIVPIEEWLANSIETALSKQKTYIQNKFIPILENFKKENPDISIYLDMGNDDFIANRNILERFDGKLFNLLHMKKHSLTPQTDIIGYMCVPPTPFDIKDWEKPDTTKESFSSQDVSTCGVKSVRNRLITAELDMQVNDTIEKDLERLSDMVDKPFVFVSHSPPYGTALDMSYGGVHVGSRAIYNFIQKWADAEKLLASFHGHVHESPNVSRRKFIKVKNTLCFNPGQDIELKWISLRMRL